MRIIEASRRQIFIFNAETYASKDAWLKYLALHLKASCGVREKLFKLSGQPRFWEVGSTDRRAARSLQTN